MILTDAMRKEAKSLGLTEQEAQWALATRVSLKRWAAAKAEIFAEEDARWEQERQLGASLSKYAEHAIVRRPDANTTGLDPEMLPPDEGESAKKTTPTTPQTHDGRRSPMDLQTST